MKLFIVGLLASCVAAFRPAVNQTEIDLINAQNSTWTAGVNSFMVGKSWDDVQQLCGTHVDDYTWLESVEIEPNVDFDADVFTPIMVHDSDITIPVSFDARERWPNNIHPIRNQQKCGSCWAFSAAEVLTDRFSIASNGRVQTVLSPEDLVSCDTTNMGCGGGQLFTAWKYMADTGIVSDACFPYSSGNGTTTPCVHTCADTESFTASKHKAKTYYRLISIENIQRDILLHGPVQTGFRVYKSFMSYKSGIYQRSWWNFLDPIMGGHAVKIVGWGTDENKKDRHGRPTDYWIVANSWDTTWGEDGYFKIKKGVNMCGIENGVYAGLPDYSSSE